MKKSVFIVDDHQLMIDGLRKILGEMEDIEIIGLAENGKNAIDKIPILSPDLVLMDLDMPNINGLEASKILLEMLPDLRIIILTMHGERPIVEKMMKIGVAGYLMKNTDQEELKLGISQVLKGEKYFQTEAFEGFVNSSELSKGVKEMKLLSELSDREIEILSLIAKGKTSSEIADELCISSRTVETHRKNIHQKLDIKNIAGLVRFAILALCSNRK